MLPRIDHVSQNLLLSAIADVLGNPSLPVPTETTIRIINGHAHITVRMADDHRDHVRDWADWIGGVPRDDVDLLNGQTPIFSTPMMSRHGSTIRAHCRITREDQ